MWESEDCKESRHVAGLQELDVSFHFVSIKDMVE
jgi:hypothetical protein